MGKEPLNEETFIVDLIFKPKAPGHILRPAETQLLLAYVGEILEEVEIEHRNIIEEERLAAQEITARHTKNKKEDTSCK